MRIRKWSLRRRLGASLVVVGVLLVGVVAASGLLLAETRSQQTLVTVNYYDGAKAINDLYLRMGDADSALRNYAMSPEQTALLAPFTSPDPPWQPGSFDHGRRLLASDHATVGALDMFEAATARWYADYAAPTIAKIKADQGVSRSDFGTDTQLFSEVRSSYSDYLDVQRAGRARAAARLQDLTIALFYAVLLSALVVVASAVLLWRVLSAWVGRPLARLAIETRVVSGGQLEHLVATDGPPEIVALGNDIEAMRQRLVAQIAALEAAGREVTSARSALENQADELQRSNRELEQFAYVASHDLQEPLRKVASFCQLLQRRYGGQLDQRADQYIEFAVDGAKRMQQLINDLLEFSRVGRHVSPQADIDLADCLTSALANLETAIEESGAQIVVENPLPRVRGEVPLLTQLLQNLIGNAIKFRSQDPPVVRIGSRADGPMWEFWCADNGIGIQDEYADRVFMIFQRLHPKEVYGGTGIGLAMGKKIVEYHGGRIWVETGVERGTTIRWTLPVPASDAPEGADGDEPPAEVEAEPAEAEPVEAEPAEAEPVEAEPAGRVP